MSDHDLGEVARRVGDLLRARGWRLAVAESCTGGWLAKVITDIPGSSQWFECGFVVYSNDAKVELLGVSPETLAAHGAVSEAVARELAAGALARSSAQIAVAITGIAGPDGGTPDKPVGTVWIAIAVKDVPVECRCRLFPGDRDAVRRAAVRAALNDLLRMQSEAHGGSR
jgi:nicotinamide-nucleotide amidase